MTAIPDDIMRAAWAVHMSFLGKGVIQTVDAIALALMEERGRAATVAYCHSDDRPRRDNMDWNDGYVDGCRGAAAAIRKGAKP